MLLSAVIAIGMPLQPRHRFLYACLCPFYFRSSARCVFGAGAIVCSRLADNGHGAKAVAVMIGGMAIANVAGVPAATFISNIFSWRAAFAIVMIFSVLTFAGLKVWMPFLEVSPDNGVKGQFRFLRGTAPMADIRRCFLRSGWRLLLVKLYRTNNDRRNRFFSGRYDVGYDACWLRNGGR